LGEIIYCSKLQLPFLLPILTFVALSLQGYLQPPPLLLFIFFEDVHGWEEEEEEEEEEVFFLGRDHRRHGRIA